MPDPSRFRVARQEPAYLELHRSGVLRGRVTTALTELEDCRVCPRNCGINRLQGETRVCHTGRHAIVSSAFPHFGEEDCLRGTRGSGTIFFGMCNLRCVFCQNWDISQKKRGREMTATEIASAMIELQERGCHNINFVTPEHVAPQVIEAIAEAADRGLHLPIVYNTSAYDALRSLELLDGLVDIYMPDFKFWEKDTCKTLSKAKDYAVRAREAIVEMHRQVGDLVVDSDGLAVRGLLVRHLVMPGQTDEAGAIFQWLASEISVDTYINIMDQYSPQFEVGQPGKDGLPRYEEINRLPTQREVRAAKALAKEAGLWRIDER